MFSRIWFRTKVLKKLQDEFGYTPAVPGAQTQVFNEITLSAKKKGLNEYDAAVMFMLAQINALTPGTDTKEFAQTQLLNISFVARRCDSPLSDIHELSAEVATRHGIQFEAYR